MSKVGLLAHFKPVPKVEHVDADTGRRTLVAGDGVHSIQTRYAMPVTVRAVKAPTPAKAKKPVGRPHGMPELTSTRLCGSSAAMDSLFTGQYAHLPKTAMYQGALARLHASANGGACLFEVNGNSDKVKMCFTPSSVGSSTFAGQQVRGTYGKVQPHAKQIIRSYYHKWAKNGEHSGWNTQAFVVEQVHVLFPNISEKLFRTSVPRRLLVSIAAFPHRFLLNPI